MRTILVIAALERGELDGSAWELLTAARALAEGGGRVTAVILGEGVTLAARELARGFDEVYAIDDARLAVPDGESDALALLALRERHPFDVLLAPHDNRGIDLLPWLAAKLDAPLLADCIQLRWNEERLAAVRTVYGGRVHARVLAASSSNGYIATVRGGAFAAVAPETETAGTVTALPLPEPFAPRRRPLRTVEATPGEVDLTQAEVLVAIGRGIEEEENLEIARSYADALGAEICCSRPIVDKGWLPKNRQVGTSGVSVRPRLYVALGISGSFQHLGGIKGKPYLIAINKDRGAPIFDVADVGIVGDVLEVVPALEAAVRTAKG